MIWLRRKAEMRERSLLILIPARRGSKGLPGKNARRLGDIPLLEWTAEAVRVSGISSDATVVLSTDDPAIADIGQAVGLDVPFIRPAELATDAASSVDVALHALNWFKQERNTVHGAVMLLQPTSPFRPPAALKSALDLFRNERYQAIVGVKTLYRSLANLFRTDNQNRLVPLGNALPSTGRQEIEPLYTPNGALYLVCQRALSIERSFFPKNSGGLMMDQIASLDIDNPMDWALAEAVVSARITWRHR